MNFKGAILVWGSSPKTYNPTTEVTVKVKVERRLAKTGCYVEKSALGEIGGVYMSDVLIDQSAMHVRIP